MNSSEIRQQFLDFFESKGHKVVDSAPLVNKDDPTLMFINAGMNQFKDFFLGTKEASHARIVDTQRCLRVSGKHNDLEEVGRDSYHHTLFEMLGNWSFGDYFKEEAIAWAWELLTEVYKIDKDRIYISVFEGDKQENLAPDTEAANIWKKYIAEDRILSFDKKDNFWEMGETGPCGPSSEIHVDLRTDQERQKQDAKDLVNADHPQVVEIWNLVFIQYNRLANGSLVPLDQKHVDTGMGFERLCMALEAKQSNYETSVFTALIAKIESITGKKYYNKYADDALQDIAMRVVADHLRAVSFAIADGCLPSNTGAGYVIRRILRRAVRYYYSFLDFKSPLLHQLVEDLAVQFEQVFPVLIQQKDFVTKVVLEEEKSFLNTLASGLERLDSLVEKGNVSGEEAFELYDTFGFPIDLTQLVASERNIPVDMQGFEKALLKQKEQSRSASQRSVGDWTILNEGEPEFIGYDALSANGVKILRTREVKTKKATLYQLVISQSPFYPEGGGQIGDRGLLRSENEKIKVLNTSKENDLIVLNVDRLPVQADHLFQVEVNKTARKDTERNHSATHLMHAALRTVLGDHVQQRGSLVKGESLRFDFSHYAKVSDEQLLQIEQIVNQKIRETIPLQEDRSIPIAEAQAAGAMMLFGEKYGEEVRMITFDSTFSRELCGGTHVDNTGQIGQFKIVSESAVAAGIRRIEALTGTFAEQLAQQQQQTLAEIKTALKNPKNLLAHVTGLQEEVKALKKELERLKQAEAGNLADQLLDQAKQLDGFKLLSAQLPLDDSKAAKGLAFQLEEKLAPAVVVLGLVSKNKPQVLVAISKELTSDKRFHAGNIVKQIAAKIGGGGGGQAFFASAGGSKVDQLPKALSEVEELLQQ